MQRLFSRLSWKNLRVRGKSTTIAFLMVALLLISTIVNSILLTNLGTQARDSSAATVEMRSLAQDIQLGVESLYRIQTTLVDAYDEPLFYLNEASYQQDFEENAAVLRNETLPELRDLTISLAEPDDQTAIREQFAALEESIDEA